MYTRKRILLVSALLLTSGTGFAATIYTQQSDFLANIAPGSYLETFNRPGTLPINALSYNFSSNGFAYTVAATPATGPFDNVYRNQEAISPQSVGSLLNVNFTSGNVTAIGGNFFSANLGGFSGLFTLQSHPVRIRLSDGTDTTFTPIDQASTFRGFTSAVPITSMIINASPQTWWAVMDNLHIGIATPIPEPESWLMMGLGLATLVFVSRKRRVVPHSG